MSKTFAKNAEYPLSWPEHIPRTENRVSSRFKVTLHQAMKSVKEELERLADDSGLEVNDITFSSNVTLGNRNPEDPGVCVFFTWDDMEQCIPIDKYDKVRCNVRAIYHMIKADRTKIRHGGVRFVMAEKRGEHTKRLPEKSNWREVLDLNGVENPTLQQLKKARNRLAKQHHKDRGGSDETMKKINKAFEHAKQELNHV